MDEVEYHPLNLSTPFLYKGKYYTRDELIRMGLDQQAHRAVVEVFKFLASMEDN